MKFPLCIALALTCLLRPDLTANADSPATEHGDDESTAAVLALLAPETRTPEVEPSPMSITPAAGLILSQPKELNSWLARSTLNGQSTAGEITWAAALSASASYAISRQMKLGLRLEYADVQNSRKVTSGDASQGTTSELSWLIPFATLEFGFPVSSRVTLGIAAGAGAAVFFHLNLQESGSEAGITQKASATYGSNPLSGYSGVFAALELSPQVDLRFEVGYRWLDATRLGATAPGEGGWSGVAEDSSLIDSSGARIPVDASSLYVNAGVTFRL